MCSDSPAFRPSGGRHCRDGAGQRPGHGGDRRRPARSPRGHSRTDRSLARRAQIVHAVRAERQGESWFKKASAQIFYRLISRWADLDLQVDACDSWLYDRVVVDVLNEMPERSRFVRGPASWVGFDQAVVIYTRGIRHASESKYPLRKMVRLAADALTGFSLVPLRFTSLIRFMMSATAFLAIPM